MRPKISKNISHRDLSSIVLLSAQETRNGSKTYHKSCPKPSKVVTLIWSIELNARCQKMMTKIQKLEPRRWKIDTGSWTMELGPGRGGCAPPRRWPWTQYMNKYIYIDIYIDIYIYIYIYTYINI